MLICTAKPSEIRMALSACGFSYACDFSGRKRGRKPNLGAAFNQSVNTLSYPLGFRCRGFSFAGYLRRRARGDCLLQARPSTIPELAIVSDLKPTLEKNNGNQNSIPRPNQTRNSTRKRYFSINRH